MLQHDFDPNIVCQHDFDPNSVRAISQTDSQTAKPTSNPNQSKSPCVLQKKSIGLDLGPQPQW